MSAPITTHILDTSAGKPAEGVNVSLLIDQTLVAAGVTDADGRVAEWDKAFELQQTNYTLRFTVSSYFKSRDVDSFYEDIQIQFKVVATDEHYHVPLLLNPFGYSTYRGS